MPKDKNYNPPFSMLDATLYQVPVVDFYKELYSEFSQKLYAIAADSDRTNAQDKWSEIDKFMSNDVPKYKNGSEYSKKLTDPTSTTINYMRMIYNANVKDILTDRVVDFTISPSGIPEKYIQKDLEEPMNLLATQLALGAISEEEAEVQGTEYRNQLIQNYIKNTANFGVILRHIYEKSNPNHWTKEIVSEALKTGNSCVKVFYDVNTPDEVKVQPLSCWDCYREPNVLDFQQSNYFITKRPIQISEFYSNREWVEFLDPQGYKNVLDMFRSQKNEYMTFVNKDKKMSDYDSMYLWEYHKKYINRDGNLTIGVFYFVGNPYQGCFELIKIIEDTKLKDFSFVWLSFGSNNRSIYGDGPLYEILPGQKDINRLDKIKTLNMLDISNGIYLMSQNSGIDVRKLSRAHADGPMYLKTNVAQPSQAIAKLDKGEITDRFLTYKDKAVDDIQRVSNLTAGNQGANSISGAKQGAVALNSANAGSVLSALCKDDLIQFNKDILELLMRVIFTFEMDEINFLKPNLGTKEKYQPIYGSYKDYEYLNGYINVSVNIMTASERNIQKQEMLQLLPIVAQAPQYSALITPQNLIKILNWDDRDQAIQRANMYASTDTAALINSVKALIGQNLMIGLEKATQQSTLEQQVEAGLINITQSTKTLNDMPDPMPDDMLQQKLVELFTNTSAFKATFNTAQTLDSSQDTFSPDNFAALMKASQTQVQSQTSQVAQQLAQAQQKTANAIYAAGQTQSAQQPLSNSDINESEEG